MSKARYAKNFFNISKKHYQRDRKLIVFDGLHVICQHRKQTYVELR